MSNVIHENYHIVGSFFLDLERFNFSSLSVNTIIYETEKEKNKESKKGMQ